MHRGRGLSGMKGGLGTASLKLGDVVIGALAVVNAAGDVLDWRSGRIVAGARRADGSFADSVEVDARDRDPHAGRGRSKIPRSAARRSPSSPPTSS